MDTGNRPRGSVLEHKSRWLILRPHFCFYEALEYFAICHSKSFPHIYCKFYSHSLTSFCAVNTRWPSTSMDISSQYIFCDDPKNLRIAVGISPNNILSALKHGDRHLAYSASFDVRAASFNVVGGCRGWVPAKDGNFRFSVCSCFCYMRLFWQFAKWPLPCSFPA